MRFILFPTILTLLFWQLSSTTASGQRQHAPQYWIQHFTDENGLPQNSVKDINRDRNGFIWLTTEAGLVRFDGHNFLVFDRSVIPISSNRISTIVPSFEHGTQTGQNEFYAVSEKADYIGIHQNGLVSVDTTFYTNYRKHNPFARQNPRRIANILRNLPAQYAFDPFSNRYFAAAGNGKYYIWWKDQISLFKGKKLIFKSTGPFHAFFLIGSVAYGIDDEGGFTTVETTRRQLTLEGDINSDSHYSRQTSHFRLFWNSVSQQTLIYLNRSLYTLQPATSGNLTTTLILTDFDFEEQNISSVFYDQANGSIFLGSLTKGLFFLKKKQFQTHRMDAYNADNAYYAQIPARGGAVLTSQGYLLSSSPDNSRTIAQKVSPFMGNLGYKYTMVQNRDSTFWLGLGLNLYKVDHTGKRTLAYVPLPEHARSLYVAPDGKLWIGCDSHVLYSLIESDGKYAPKKMFTLGVKGVTIMKQKNAETMLLGAETGLYMINIRSGAFKTVKSLENMNVRSFYSTPDGIWITTYGSGIYFLKDDKLITLPLDRNRYLATAHCIIEDSKGFFWITTNRGLFQVAKKQLIDHAAGKKSAVYYLYYDKSSGFETNEFNGGCLPCALTLADGTVSLPSMDGLVWFKPETIRPELPDKGIFINAVFEDEKALPIADTLNLSQEYGLLRLALATPYMGNFRNIQMQYALSGARLAREWVQVDSDFTIRLPKMSYGTYELKIRKVDGFGSDYTFKTVYLRIPRAWYETNWFRLLAFLTLLALLFIFVRLRAAHLVKKERKNSLLRHYRVISQIMAAVHHDIQTPLHYIGYGLEYINTYLHKKATGDPLVIRMSDESLNTSHRLNTLTKNILNYIKLQSKAPASRLTMETVAVATLISPISKLFEAVATFREISLRTDVAPDLTVYSDVSLLSIILHNLIDNAIKVAQTEITVSASCTNGQPQIIIVNDGMEMPEEHTEWLNRRFKSYEDWTSASPNPDQKGIGLVIVKDLCMLLGITINASVIDNTKTLITLSFIK